MLWNCGWGVVDVDVVLAMEARGVVVILGADVMGPLELERREVDEMEVVATTGAKMVFVVATRLQNS